jgi:hypothetical protein
MIQHIFAIIGEVFTFSVVLLFLYALFMGRWGNWE